MPEESALLIKQMHKLGEQSATISELERSLKMCRMQLKESQTKCKELEEEVKALKAHKEK